MVRNIDSIPLVLTPTGRMTLPGFSPNLSTSEGLDSVEQKTMKDNALLLHHQLLYNAKYYLEKDKICMKQNSL